jgi:flagellar motor switch protein FliN/FliY
MAKERQAIDAQDEVFKNPDDAPSKEEGNMELIMDIPLTITVELGRTSMLINDLLKLIPGSVVELNKLAGEPMEIFINKRLVARGEVVVVNEKFGVRLTDIISPMAKAETIQ